MIFFEVCWSLAIETNMFYLKLIAIKKDRLIIRECLWFQSIDMGDLPELSNHILVIYHPQIVPHHDHSPTKPPPFEKSSEVTIAHASIFPLQKVLTFRRHVKYHSEEGSFAKYTMQIILYTVPSTSCNYLITTYSLQFNDHETNSENH